MSMYEQAFHEGEEASFRDRKVGKQRLKPVGDLSPYATAWFDGYTPRSTTWRQPTRQWWMDHEEEEETA